MNTRILYRLAERLQEQGCCNFCIEAEGIAVGRNPDDVYVLKQQDGQWCVYYQERGNKDAPIFKSNDLSEACDFYYRHITAQIHNHLVIITRSCDEAEDCRLRLAAQGIYSFYNDIPHYCAVHDHVYRLFVQGEDIFAARKILGNLPRDGLCKQEIR